MSTQAARCSPVGVDQAITRSARRRRTRSVHHSPCFRRSPGRNSPSACGNGRIASIVPKCRALGRDLRDRPGGTARVVAGPREVHRRLPSRVLRASIATWDRTSEHVAPRRLGSRSSSTSALNCPASRRHPPCTMSLLGSLSDPVGTSGSTTRCATSPTTDRTSDRRRRFGPQQCGGR